MLSKIFTAHIALAILLFHFKGAALSACTLVVEASAAADAEPQKHKIVISLVNRKRIISINT